jgi:hypothetical protein
MRAKKQIWTSPQNSRREVNRAGEILIDPNSTPEQKESAIEQINNWRLAHAFPLNTFQNRLRIVGRSIDQHCLVAQRTKRLTSIVSKLERIKGFKLAQIQDIGGCRAIVRTINDVENVVYIYQHKSRGVKHEFVKEDNYIDTPKETGYRSVHLIYRYKSDKNPIYDGLKIEIQVRTVLQHAWATAVEAVDTFTNQSLKAGFGEPKWLRFFALVSSYFAQLEGKPIVPSTPSDLVELRKEIQSIEAELNVVTKLKSYRTTVSVTDRPWTAEAYYYLLELDTTINRVRIYYYTKQQAEIANNEYSRLEAQFEQSKKNVVLVSVESITALKLAYPNYYLDTDIFLAKLEEIISGTVQLSLFE